MFILIYSIYVEALTFIRKNIFLTIPFVLNGFFRFSVSRFEGSSSGLLFGLFHTVIFPCLIEIYMILYVFRTEKIIDLSLTIPHEINKLYKQAVLLYFLGYAVFYAILMPFFFLYINSLRSSGDTFNLGVVYLLTTVFGILLFIGNMLGLRILVLRNINAVSAFREGSREIWKARYYYLIVYSFNILITTLPSILAFFTFSFITFVPVAEFDFFMKNNLLSNILLGLLYTWNSVAITYAFLENNKNQKHAS